ncbi:hypothetical protein [Massilia antarctica]|uniref:hypothetical protein n=1 Tax=Massilia antarctica TaxID=2765360 RepID=UPI0006BE0C70|nr:hypothetical protein [Massilia sp. H27-R4]MCY0916202.1 hypothetical protein [Massilia sp. H27-R4]CUI07972.1 hypothetical protein BN2497_10721 [Janthinobacterium sp. CG23_2]CUU31758.1 hypothetical protein BN3177_10721 [Janthinobacterium sp. CG23_2]
MKFPFLIAMMLAAGVAPAQEAEAVKEVDTVQVNALRDPDFKTYRAFVAGLDAFDSKHALAPASALRFLLRPSVPNASIEGVTIRIAGNETSIEVPLAADGTFVMQRNQAALDEHADIILNRKKGSFRWRPDVHTPEVPANARRLGDLRLECEVRWAVDRQDVPFVKRTLLATLGGPCRTSRVHVIQLAPRALAGYRMVAGERNVTAPAGAVGPDGMTYVAPLHDASWPDDTLVEFELAGQK